MEQTLSWDAHRVQLTESRSRHSRNGKPATPKLAGTLRPGSTKPRQTTWDEWVNRLAAKAHVESGLPGSRLLNPHGNFDLADGNIFRSIRDIG